MMVREYQKENVYEALQERFHFIFQEFDNIYISFSGGKDSGLLLNLHVREQYLSVNGISEQNSSF